MQKVHHESFSSSLVPPFSSGSTTGLTEWLSCTSSKYPMGRWLIKVDSCQVIVTNLTRSTTALWCLSLGLSPRQTLVKTSSSVSCQGLNCQVSILTQCKKRNQAPNVAKQQFGILLQPHWQQLIFFQSPLTMLMWVLWPTKAITMSAQKPISCTRWTLRLWRQPKRWHGFLGWHQHICWEKSPSSEI